MKYVKLFESFLNEAKDIDKAVEAFYKEFENKVNAVGSIMAQAKDGKVFSKEAIVVDVESANDELPSTYMGFDVKYNVKNKR